MRKVLAISALSFATLLTGQAQAGTSCVNPVFEVGQVDLVEQTSANGTAFAEAKIIELAGGCGSSPAYRVRVTASDATTFVPYTFSLLNEGEVVREEEAWLAGSWGDSIGVNTDKYDAVVIRIPGYPEFTVNVSK